MKILAFLALIASSCLKMLANWGVIIVAFVVGAFALQILEARASIRFS